MSTKNVKLKVLRKHLEENHLRNKGQPNEI